MGEKKRFIQSKYAHHLQDTKTDIHYYLTVEKIGCKELFDEIERLTEENEQLQKENVFLAKQRSYWKGKSDMAVETFEIDEATEKKISELEKENERLKSELNDCAFFLYGMFGEMNDNPVVLKKYKELFDDG